MAGRVRCLIDIRDDEVRADREQTYRRRDPSTFRRMGCGCDSDPVRVRHDHGCRCSSCGEVCRECPGMGWARPQRPRAHKVIDRVRKLIRLGTENRGAPPEILRLTRKEIGSVVHKWHEDDEDNEIRKIVDVGPPLRIYNTVIVEESS